MNFLWFLIIGGVAGWLAGILMKGRGLGIVVNIIVGVIGGFLGGWLFSRLGISFGVGDVGEFITSFLGAVILLIIVSLFTRR